MKNLSYMEIYLLMEVEISIKLLKKGMSDLKETGDGSLYYFKRRF